MNGNPGDPIPVKRGPYARISKNGNVSEPIPLKGKPDLRERKSMTDDQIRYDILDLLTEDYYGLWELAGLASAPPVDELIRVLDGLIRDGLVEIYVGSDFASEERVLSAEKAQRAIRDRAFWEWSAPERGEHVRGFATRAGDDWYFGRKP
jgi:hypothetical protein